MPAILAKMDDNPFGAGQFSHGGRGYRFGFHASPRLPQRGNVVYIDG
jgi:hypothetical protein